MTERWKNWAGDQRCAPARIVRPGSEDELAEVVARAAADGLPVRAAGAGHSFTDIACTDGVLVDTSGMQRMLDADPATGLVTVEAGVRLRVLGEQLARHGLALENQGDIDAQALAGALATATHGTGAAFGNLSTRVVGMRLVLASGDVVDVDGRSDPEALLAARVSVGALGIASTVTLQTVPLYTLHRHDRPLPLDATLDALDAHVDGDDHFEFFLFPYTRTAAARSTRRSTETPVPTPVWRRRVQEDLVENAALELVCRSGRRFRSQVPRLNRLMARTFAEHRVQDHAYKVYATTRAVRFTEMEYAIPRPHAREALERSLDLIERRGLPILFPFEVRFAAADDAFLSTAHARDSCYIAVHQYTGMEYESCFRGVEAIMDEYGGRPHWGKRHYQSAATLRERYPEWARFQAVRRRLDPDGVFTNDYVRRVLGPVDGGGAA
ncbi:L-gulono-1,4-lactone dehydrogenase [Paraconexibacter sp. AEG42_29]|uniref:L-gulono-1,4-lactone dehydrogenase n=1 Tax=Paraconexibacter sp. AEG42_29 TaxID=2997339 RepID=A0AAU7ATT4_9ACTN